MEPVCFSTNLPNSYNNGIQEDFGKPMEENIDEGDAECEAATMFATFDKNRDGVLDYEEFSSLLQAIFHTDSLATASTEKIQAFMSKLDSNGDGVIDDQEFQHAWLHCFKKVLHPVNALIIVDVQNDFIDGSLALRNCPAKQDGAEVVPVINRLLEESQFDVVVYSMDWHPHSHISFVNNVSKYPLHHTCPKTSEECSTYDEVQFDLSPLRSQVLWPAHCIQHSEGAKLASNLKIAADPVNIYKGTNTDIDSYSAFFDNMRLSQTSLQDELDRRNVTDAYICGLAYDVCVAATSRDAVDLGYRTVVVDDACRGVDDDNIASAKEQLQRLGALVLQSDEAIRHVNKTASASFELGLFAAQTMPALVST